DAVEQARAQIEPIRKGQSALSAVVMDEKVYDDLRELVQHLKKRPWKLFWKE
ncbi:MAG: MCE family protein, partial [Deltaproteobacteria bacterium]|nr:MCE family protein [Deltaproteobacteria bacterium]MBW2531360.1 MCE family protein [Deltaproteobacteria bacterium]